MGGGEGSCQIDRQINRHIDVQSIVLVIFKSENRGGDEVLGKGRAAAG